MPVLIPRRIPWTQNPEGSAEADYPGLHSAYFFTGGAGGANEAVRGISGDSPPSDFTWEIDSDQGRVIRKSAVNDNSLILPILPPTGGAVRSLLIRYKPDANALSGDKVIVEYGEDTTGKRWTLRLVNGDLRFEVNGAGATSSLSLTSGTWHDIGVSQSSNTFGSVVLFRDASSQGLSGTLVLDTDGANKPNVMGEFKGSSHLGGTGDIAYIVWLNRAHTQDEFNELRSNPLVLLKPRRRWVPVVIQGGAGATVSVGLASELSTAQAISRLKQKAVGLSAETDTALATSPAKVTAVGLSTETYTAFSILRSKIKTAGLSNETDSAFALIVSNAVNVGLSDETDSALAISRLKQNPVGLSTETDAALSMGRSKIRIAGLGIETDVAFTISRSKLKALGLSSEVDQALAISSSGSLAVGLASELDVALVIGRLKQQLLSQSSETDLSQPVSRIKTQQAGLSTESDSALAVTGSSGRAVGLATETDLAQSISRIKQRLIGLAPETDVALTVTIAGVTVVINTNAKETLKLLAENPTLTLS